MRKLMCILALLTVCPSTGTAQDSTVIPTLPTVSVNVRILASGFRMWSPASRHHARIEIADSLIAICRQRFAFINWRNAVDDSVLTAPALELGVVGTRRHGRELRKIRYAAKLMDGPSTRLDLDTMVIFEPGEDHAVHDHTVLIDKVGEAIGTQFSSEKIRNRFQERFLRKVPLASLVLPRDKPNLVSGGVRRRYVVPVPWDSLRSHDSTVFLVEFQFSDSGTTVIDGEVHLSHPAPFENVIWCRVTEMSLDHDVEFSAAPAQECPAELLAFLDQARQGTVVVYVLKLYADEVFGVIDDDLLGDASELWGDE